MRQRKKKWAQPYLDTSEFIIRSRAQSEIEKAFALFQPLFLEIGTGKGDFITTMAKKYPHYNFIGIELQPTVLAIAVKKAEEAQLSNLRFMLIHAELIEELFAKDAVSGIYLNFSDPWPKARHEKRRLTSPTYLSKYHQILKANGLIAFKSDNYDLYRYTLEVIQNEKFELIDKQENYILIDNDAETEYERRLRAMGQTIYRILLRKKD